MKKLLTCFMFLFIGLSLHGMGLFADDLVEKERASQNKMYKNPGCMCCDRWVEHMQNNGINLEIVPSEKMNQIRNEHGVPDDARGCHTSIIDGIIVEGHVPADLVVKILKERPEGVIGIAVPGMPMGSPGMEGGYKDDYSVVLFDSKGEIYFYEMR